MWVEVVEIERGRFREEGRARKESLVACGSNRECCERKESRPRIGAEVVVLARVVRNKRRRVTMVMVGIIRVCLGHRETGERERWWWW